MAKVAAAAGAMGLGARDSDLIVGAGSDGAADRRGEAWPAGAAVELGLRAEQRLVASRAMEGAAPLLAIQRAGPGALGRVLTQHGISGRAQPLSPLCVAQLDRKAFPGAR